MTDVVLKLWGFCHTLRHDGIGYGEYIEQITYLLFLKMAHEREIPVPPRCDWSMLRDQSGSELTEHYASILRELGKSRGILGDIFAGAQSRFTKPASLKRLINLIDETEWTTLGVDVKAQAYEGLLEKAASEGKKGAGQYFTPRVLIDSITRCMRPDPRTIADFKICDPACGTGGFLVSAYEWLIEQTKGGALDRATVKRIKSDTYFGQDIAELPRRLALMNLILHGIEPTILLGDTIYEAPDTRRFDVILTNPPFGTKGANQAPDREDFTIATSNKQLNFIQHVLTILKPGGRAAIVLPDNCLFADQAGEVFKILTEDCNLHTVLRLPHGTFTPYSTGVKANVVFLTKGSPTERTWIYDGRTNIPGITKKDRPLAPEHFEEFEFCYGASANGNSRRSSSDSSSNRWKPFTIQQIKEREFKLAGFKWLKEESLEDADESGDPEEIATDLIDELEFAIEVIRGWFLSGEQSANLARFGRPAVRSLDQFALQLSQVPNMLKQIHRATLSAAMVGKLTETWREQHAETAETATSSPITTALKARMHDSARKGNKWSDPSFEFCTEKQLPPSWEYIALGNLGEWFSGGTPSKAESRFWTDATIPWVTPKDMKRPIIADSIDHVSNAALSEGGIRMIPKNTIMLVVRGMILAHTFPVALAARELTFNQDIKAIVPHPEIDPMFLLYGLQSTATAVLHAVKEATHGTLRLESDILKAWPIAVPPISEQARIVEILNHFVDVGSAPSAVDALDADLVVVPSIK